MKFCQRRSFDRSFHCVNLIYQGFRAPVDWPLRCISPDSMAAGVSFRPPASSNSIEDISPKNAPPRETGPKWNSTENASDSFRDTNLPSVADVRPFLEFLS